MAVFADTKRPRDGKQHPSPRPTNATIYEQGRSHSKLPQPASIWVSIEPPAPQLRSGHQPAGQPCGTPGKKVRFSPPYRRTPPGWLVGVEGNPNNGSEGVTPAVGLCGEERARWATWLIGPCFGQPQHQQHVAENAPHLLPGNRVRVTGGCNGPPHTVTGGSPVVAWAKKKPPLPLSCDHRQPRSLTCGAVSWAHRPRNSGVFSGCSRPPATEVADNARN